METTGCVSLPLAFFEWAVFVWWKWKWTDDKRTLLCGVRASPYLLPAQKHKRQLLSLASVSSSDVPSERRTTMASRQQEPNLTGSLSIWQRSLLQTLSLFSQTYVCVEATTMGDEYVSYKSPTTIVAETVYHFLRGGMYGAAFGLVTPFHPPNSPAALKGKPSQESFSRIWFALFSYTDF